MQYRLRAKGVRLSRQLVEHVERRVHFAASRFGDRVRRVQVQLLDVNGPRGGEDVLCRIQASLAPRGTVIVEERRAEPFAAVARAADRAGHAVGRAVERMRGHRREARVRR